MLVTQVEVEFVLMPPGKKRRCFKENAAGGGWDRARRISSRKGPEEGGEKGRTRITKSDPGSGRVGRVVGRGRDCAPGSGRGRV